MPIEDYRGLRGESIALPLMDAEKAAVLLWVGPIDPLVTSYLIGRALDCIGISATLA